MISLSKNLYAILTFAFAATALILTAQTAQAAERKFTISSFEDIRIIGSVNVAISTNRGVSASATAANREILDRVLLRKSGSQLIVSMKPKTGDNGYFSADEPVTVTLSSHVVKTITHSGSGAVVLDKLGGRDARARLSGFGVLTIGDVDSDTLDIAMTGGGQIAIAGKARNGRIELLGSSMLDGSGLTLDSLHLIQRGPASTHVTVEKEVTISNSGTGNIQIDGRPNCSVRTSGAAQIICGSSR